MLLQPGSILRTRIQTFFRHIRIHIISDNTVSAQLKIFETVSKYCRDISLQGTILQDLINPALRFDFLEFRPDFFLDLSGQRLYCPGTACRIDWLQQAEFLLQDDLYISRNTTGKFISLSYWFIEWCIFIGIHPTDNTGKNFCCITQHIDIRIINCFEKQCRPCMDVHALCVFTAAKSLDNLRPDRTNRAKFGNLHKEIRSHGKTKHDLPCCFINRQPTFLQFSEIRHACSQCPGNLLNIIGTAAAQCIAANHDRTKIRRIRYRPLCTRCHFIIKLCKCSIILSSLHELPKRICSNKPLDFFQFFTFRLNCRSGQRQHRQGRRSAIKIKRMFLQFQTIQQFIHILNRCDITAFIAYFPGILCILIQQTRRIQTNVINRRAFICFMTKQFIIFLRQSFIATLRYPPWFFNIPIRTCTAKEIIHTGKFRPGQNIVCHPARIHRFKGNPFIGPGIHLLFKGCSLQERNTILLPFLIRWWFELIQRNLWKICLLISLVQHSLKIKILILPPFVFAHTTASF